MTRSRLFRIVLLAGLLLAGGIYLTAEAPPARDASRSAIKRVTVAGVEPATTQRDLRFAGVTRADRRARLAFAIGGRVTARPVDIGDRVDAGDVVARLDARELRNAVDTASATVAELEARRRQTERDVERAERLVEAKAATPEELEQVRAGLESMEASETAAASRLREARRLLDETTLRAPFAGTVTEVLLEPGEYATPGRAVVGLSGAGGVEVEVQVPESVAPRIAEGDAVRVRLGRAASDSSRELRATVQRVGRATGGPGQLFPVVVALPDDPGAPEDDVPAGVTVEILLSLTGSDGLSVPVEAVINPGGRRPALFRVVDGGPDGPGTRVEKVFVEVGSLLGDRVVVRAVAADGSVDDTLRPGDRVVVGGQRGLLDGESVEVLDAARGDA